MLNHINSGNRQVISWNLFPNLNTQYFLQNLVVFPNKTPQAKCKSNSSEYFNILSSLKTIIIELPFHQKILILLSYFLWAISEVNHPLTQHTHFFTSRHGIPPHQFDFVFSHTHTVCHTHINDLSGSVTPLFRRFPPHPARGKINKRFQKIYILYG